MKKATDVVKKMLSSLATTMIDGDTREWPPTCAVLLYQPVRPYSKDLCQDNCDTSENQ